MDAPYYPYKPIHSLKALSLALGEPVALLQSLAKRGSNLYRYVPQKKKDKTVRHTYDAYEPLKRIQRKIVDRFLSRVRYPDYLHGGIKDITNRRSIYSNARMHGKAKTILLQDIKNFFPSITVHHAHLIFLGCLRFSPEVAQILALLTTRNGIVPQGASTSGYLANLVFWDVEPSLVMRLRGQGLKYSRFADDITISAATPLEPATLTELVSAVTGMLAEKGCHQKRSKLHVRKRGQTILAKSGYDPLTVTGLSVFNEMPGLPKAERKAIRAAVKELEDLADQETIWSEIDPRLRTAMGRVGRLIACGHPDGQRYRLRLKALRDRYDVTADRSIPRAG